MRVVRWVIVLLTIAVCAGAAALLTTMLLEVLELAEGYRYSIAAVVALMVCWLTAPKLIRWANERKRTPSADEHRQAKHRPF